MLCPTLFLCQILEEVEEVVTTLYDSDMDEMTSSSSPLLLPAPFSLDSGGQLASADPLTYIRQHTVGENTTDTVAQNSQGK